MATSTFKMDNENEAIVLVDFFKNCDIYATHKGAVVKATGDSNIIAYLYDKFVTIALI